MRRKATRIGLKSVIGVTLSPGVGSSLDEEWSKQRKIRLWTLSTWCHDLISHQSSTCDVLKIQTLAS